MRAKNGLDNGVHFTQIAPAVEHEEVVENISSKTLAAEATTFRKRSRCWGLVQQKDRIPSPGAPR